MAHPLEHRPATAPLAHDDADALANAMRAFGTGSRIRLLWALLEGERTVEQLAEATQLSQTLASQQLRVLRDLRFVAVRRDGRHHHYRLYSHHLPALLAAIRHHQEHREDATESAVAAEAAASA
ncbi:MAG: helix-turn-helix transcriptional regulator [Solirubrobacteraceae bacterium]|nr:helix-turn-helix transcriptional regulator [Solirubrobacteraceae bacterium]